MAGECSVPARFAVRTNGRAPMVAIAVAGIRLVCLPRIVAGAPASDPAHGSLSIAGHDDPDGPPHCFRTRVDRSPGQRVCLDFPGAGAERDPAPSARRAARRGEPVDQADSFEACACAWTCAWVCWTCWRNRLGRWPVQRWNARVKPVMSE
jgi:hypothetical protein